MRHNERLHDLVVIWEETQIVNRKNQPCIIFCHEQFDGIELRCVKHFTRVEEECHTDHTFAGEGHRERNHDNETVIEAPNNTNTAELPMVPLPDDIFHMGNCAEDIATVRGVDFSVDDDNEPAHENASIILF